MTNQKKPPVSEKRGRGGGFSLLPTCLAQYVIELGDYKFTCNPLTRDYMKTVDKYFASKELKRWCTAKYGS